MKIIDADPSRLIDLPGVGPCPRPVDIDERVTGFSTLKSLRIYTFTEGQPIEGESEGDEVYVLPIGGAVGIAIEGAHPLTARLSDDGPRALYMTPGHAYRLTPQSARVQVAYARAAASGSVACHTVGGTTGDRAETLRFRLVDLTDGAALDHHTGGERLMHIIAGKLRVDGTEVTAPQTVALAKGEAADIRASGPAKVLLVHV